MATLQSALPDIMFGFNNPKFSDRIIRILIVPDDFISNQHHHVRGTPLLASTTRNQPRSTSKAHAKGGTAKSTKGSVEISNNLRPLKPLEIGNEASTSSEILQEKCIHVSSLILAAHSPFFEKLFTNGMKETGQQHATIHILNTEEAAFMDLLKFMYSGKLSRAKPSALRAVIGIADKFDVASCVNLCGQVLIKLSMTLEVALLYFDLDSNGLMADFVGPNLDGAKNFVGEHFKDIMKVELQEELLKLPLVGVEAVLSSDCLQVKSEDDIYDIISKWVQSHYSDQLEERRTVLNTLVRRFLRFPFLSTKKMESIMTCSIIEPGIVSELALEALCYYKAQPPHRRRPDKCRERAYTNLPLKSVLVDSSSSHPHYVIYLDLKREECEKILRGSTVESQTFFLGEHQFSLCVCHTMNADGTYCFGLCFVSSKASETTFNIACDIASRGKHGEFVRRTRAVFVMAKGRKRTSNWDVFRVPWTTVISQDSPYFMKNVLYLRFDLTLKT